MAYSYFSIPLCSPKKRGYRRRIGEQDKETRCKRDKQGRKKSRENTKEAKHYWKHDRNIIYQDSFLSFLFYNILKKKRGMFKRGEAEKNKQGARGYMR